MPANQRVYSPFPTLEYKGFELRCLTNCDIVATDSADRSPGRVIANAVGRATTVRAAVSSFAILPMYTHTKSIRAGDDADTVCCESVLERAALSRI